MPTHFPGVPRWDLFILVLLPYTYTLSLKLWSFDKLEQFTKYIPIQDWHRIEWSRFRNASNLRSRLLSSSRNPSLPIMHHADDILGVYTLQFLHYNAPVTFFCQIQEWGTVNHYVAAYISSLLREGYIGCLPSIEEDHSSSSSIGIIRGTNFWCRIILETQTTPLYGQWIWFWTDSAERTGESAYRWRSGNLEFIWDLR